MSKRPKIFNEFAYKGIIRSDFVLNRSHVLQPKEIEQNELEIGPDNAFQNDLNDSILSLNENINPSAVHFEQDENSPTKEPTLNNNTTNLDTTHLSAGMLALFFASNLTQTGLKLVAEFVNSIGVILPKTFNQASNALLSKVGGTSLNYSRKVYCMQCKKYSKFSKSLNKCNMCKSK
jgi:hypothetical protein